MCSYDSRHVDLLINKQMGIQNFENARPNFSRNMPTDFRQKHQAPCPKTGSNRAQNTAKKLGDFLICLGLFMYVWAFMGFQYSKMANLGSAELLNILFQHLFHRNGPKHGRRLFNICSYDFLMIFHVI